MPPQLAKTARDFDTPVVEVQRKSGPPAPMIRTASNPPEVLVIDPIGGSGGGSLDPLESEPVRFYRTKPPEER
jgi:hypothetical protein